MNEQVPLSQLNAVEHEPFVQLLADIFEHSPWIPSGAWSHRPFESIFDLHSKMVEVVEASTVEEQLGLLKAHPELAGKETIEGGLTDLSSSEQEQVGMNSLSREEILEVSRLNASYREKFAFPFIVAVRDNTKGDIFRKWRQRLNNSLEVEIRTCLDQVYLIAKLRLTDLICESTT